MTHSLGSMLARTFRAPAPRQPDTHRKAREAARHLAAAHSIEIEALRPGFNVWPPKSWRGADPFEGDHHADHWGEVLAMVQAYAEGCAAA